MNEFNFKTASLPFMIWRSGKPTTLGKSKLLSLP